MPLKRFDVPRWLSTLLLLVGLFRSGAVSAASPIESPAELWHGYDPRAVPLDVKVIESWKEQGTRFQKLRFTAEVVDGQPVRVFSIVGTTADAALRPGVLHIHGGGQTASLDWVKFWTSRGYACVTYDFCGEWEGRQEFTDWGPLKHGNMAHAAGGHQVTPTPRNSSWYHWTLVARRALTLLEKQPGVDRQRLGIFGISVGGTLCWSVAGSDDRVKAAVPIYGCGYNVDGTRERWGFGKLTPELALFQRAVSPEAHAPYVTCPLLHLNATNDFHGWLNRSYDILAATPAAHWQAITPWQNHHIAAEQGENLPLWMDAQLKGGAPFPDAPRLQLRIGEHGVPQAVVSSADQQVLAVDVYYSLGDKLAPNRFWRRSSATVDENGHLTELPVVDTWQPLWAFANVRFASGACLSSNLITCVPGMLGKARASLVAGQPLEPRLIAESWHYARGYTDPNRSARFVVVEELPGRGFAVSQNPEVFGSQVSIDLSSHAIGDPQFAQQSGALLAFDCQGDVSDEGLQVTLSQHEWTPLARTYVANVKREELSPDWQTIVLPLARFQPQTGQPPATSWSEFDKINLRGTSPQGALLKIANLRWLSESAGQEPSTQN